MNIINKKARASMQILLLIAGMFAFVYLVYNSTNARADDLAWKCCEKAKKGAVCQDVVYEEDCSDSAIIVPSKCEATDFCKLGCCIDNYGNYEPNTPKKRCEERGGRWEDNKDCNIPEARLGCCVLGDTTAYVTDAKCSFLSELRGSKKDYKQDWNEAHCVFYATRMDVGACVLSNRNCKFTTAQDCDTLRGDFHPDYLCTTPSLNTTCEKTEKTACKEERDEVFFTDSCGNIANIYDASKINDDNYWTKVYEKEESCNPDSGNENSKKCGNCDRFLGGICSQATNINPDYGDFYCKSTSCMYQGKQYKNGEAWCVYEGKIGDGDDIPGSRYWRYLCDYGEIQIEPCRDYRKEICTQHITEDPDTGETFSDASCRDNRWEECIEYNSAYYDEQERKNLCEENPDCDFRHIYLSSDFNFDMCTPRYPPGFDLDRTQENNFQCSFADNTCTVVKVKELRDFSVKWVTKQNKDCLDNNANYLKQMNDWCRSLGDCGVEVNIIGELGDNEKDNYAVIIDEDGNKIYPKLSNSEKNKLIKMQESVKGQIAEPGDISIGGMFGFPQDSADTWLTDYNAEKEVLDKFGMGAAGLGYVMAAASWYGITIYGTGPLAGEVGLTGALSLAKGGAATAGNFGPIFTGFSNFLSGIGAAMIMSSIATWAFGLQGQAADIMTWGGLAVAVTAMVVWGVKGCAATGPAFAFCAVVIILLAALLEWIGIGDTKTITVQYKCRPWQPPIGGDDCDECNPDQLKPCTEYRCKSLGSACSFINKGTDNAICIEDNINDATPPILGPQYGTISEGEKYSSADNNGFKITAIDGGCLDAYDNIVFGINTNEPAQCKYSSEMKDFEEMENYLGTNDFVYNHTATTYLPDPSHGQSQGLDITADMKLYVKCRDTHGNMILDFYTIEMCVKEGDDITAPAILSEYFNPKSGTLVGYNTTNKTITLYTYEAADCKWSAEDKSYDEMENSADFCLNNIQDRTAYGYACYVTLPITEPGENKFFFRCKDQPWLESVGRGDERNPNLQSTPYVLKRVENPLTIDWISPDKDFEVATPFTSIILKAHTSGGGQYVKCSYKVNDYSLVRFLNTFSDLHENHITLHAGKNKIYIECEDETGDKTSKEIEFEIIHDSSSPQVARVYQDKGRLKIITTESSECKYSASSCNYDFDKADSMGIGLEHSVPVSDKTYYVRCRDNFGNLPSSGSCSVIVRPLDLQ